MTASSRILNSRRFRELPQLQVYDHLAERYTERAARKQFQLGA